MTVDLYNGDCLDVLQTIPDGSVDMILTDLPYGTTRNSWDSVIPLEPLWEQYRRVAKENAAILLFSQQPFTTVLGASNLSELRYEWIWQKSHISGFLNANRAPLKSHENILVFYRRAPKYNPQKVPTGKLIHRTVGGTETTNYGDFERQKASGIPSQGYPKDILSFDRWGEFGHPTQKPVVLCEYLIRTYTDEGETVLDSCMGSGTTGVAAVQSGRSFIGIELDEGYFEMAKRRIAEAGPVSRDYMNGQTKLGSFDSEEVGQ